MFIWKLNDLNENLNWSFLIFIDNFFLEIEFTGLGCQVAAEQSRQLQLLPLPFPIIDQWACPYLRSEIGDNPAIDLQLQLLHLPSEIKRSRISQAKIVGFSRLYCSILETTVGVATFGLEPPIRPGGRKEPAFQIAEASQEKRWKEKQNYNKTIVKHRSKRDKLNEATHNCQ